MNLSTAPTTAEDLREALHQRIVKFFFVKKDGSLREAVGTTNLTHIPASGHPRGNGSSPKVVVFWDFLRGGWRSLQVTTQVFIKE